MSTTTNTNPSSSPLSPEFTKYAIHTTSLPTSPDITLTPTQHLLTCSILDLFSGFPTKRKLTLWSDTASFHDPLANAIGRTQYEAQWYGLKAAFSEIERLDVNVTKGGNPIEIDLKMRYKIKGLGAEQTVDSVVSITTEGEGEEMKIKKVEDRWGGEIKEGPIKNVLRGLNASALPRVVSVPKSVEEEEGEAPGNKA